MKIACFADLHARPFRLDDFKAVWGQAVKIAGEMADYFIILGDTFHKNNVIIGATDSSGVRYNSLGDVVQAVLDPLLRAGKKTIILRGNHDLLPGEHQDALYLLEKDGLITVDRDCMVHSDAYDEIGLVLLSLPWQKNQSKEDRIETLETFREASKKASKPVILAGHLHVVGARANPGIVLATDEFSFTKEELRSIGADHIALGHIHLRDLKLGYVGAIQQLNYGYSDHPTGFLLIDTDTKEEKYIEVESKKYHRFKSWKEYGEKAKDLDPKKCYIRVQDKTIPAEGLPDGVEFDKQIDKPKYARRTEVDPGASIKTFLEEYYKINPEYAGNVSLPDAMKKFEAHYQYETARENQGIKLDKILSIRLENIGAHESTEIQFGEEAITAITGQNGKGKTFLIGAVPLCFWGDLPSYPGTIYDQVTQGFIGIAEIEVNFISQGVQYRALRRIDKSVATKKQEAYLWKDGVKDPIAGKKVREFEKVIGEIVGSRKHYLATGFFAQNNDGDFLDLEDGDRKKQFQEMLGGHDTTGYEKIFDVKHKDIVSEIKSQEYHISHLKEEVEGYDNTEINGLLIENVDLRQILKDKLKDMQTQSEQTTKQIAVEEAKENKTRNQEKEKRTLTEEINNLRNEIFRNEKTIMDNPIDKYFSMMKQASEEDKKQAGLTSELKELELSFAGREKVLREKNDLDADIQRITQDLENSATSLSEKITGLKKQAKLKLNAEIKILEQTITSLGNKEIMLEKSGCKGSIPCLFLDDANDAAEKLPSLISDKKEKLNQLFSKDLDSETQAEIDNLKNELHKIRNDITVQDLEEQLSQIIVPEVNQMQLQKLRNEAHNNPAPRMKADAAMIKERREQAKTNLESNKKRLADSVKKLEELQVSEFNSELLETLRNKLANHRELQRLIQADIDKITKQITEYKYKLSRLEELVAGIDKNEKKLKEMEKEYAVMEFLLQAMGKDGIPQLVLDSAIPPIQDNLNSIIDEYELPFRVAIETQRELKTGESREGLSILYIDKRGSREARRASGGEKQIVRTMIRLAICKYNSERFQNRSRVFIADEPLKGLTGDYTFKILSIFRGSFFDQIILCSHDEGVIAASDREIEMK